MFIILYLTISLVVLYTEARDCYITKRKFEIGSEMLFSFTWPLSLPLAVYTIWKEQK